MFKPFIFIRCLIVTMIVTLSGCSTDTTRPDEQGQQPSSPADKNKPVSISSSDRENNKKAIAALNNADLATAQSIFEEILSNNPGLAGPHSNLALIHYKNKEYTQSFKMVEKAIQLNPNQAQAYHLRGQLYIAIGKVHDAKSDYLKAIKLKPDYLNAQYNIALLYDVYLQEIELAIKHYEIYMSLLKKPDEAIQEWINHLKGTLKDA